MTWPASAMPAFKPLRPKLDSAHAPAPHGRTVQNLAYVALRGGRPGPDTADHPDHDQKKVPHLADYRVGQAAQIDALCGAEKRR